jgi:uncharacterized protein (DUF2062 family)
VVAVLRRLWEKLRALWRLARNERASPRQIGWAVGLGAFCGCTPALGFHGGLALFVATLFRVNRLFCWLGSRVSNIVVLPFIVFAEVQVAHRLRTGDWVTLDPHRALDQARGLLLDWFLGTIPVGGAIGLVLGLASWAVASRRARKRSGGAGGQPAAAPE